MLDWFWEWKGEILVEGHEVELFEDLTWGCGFSVSNGSFSQGHGMAVWIIEGQDHRNQLIRKTVTPGTLQDQSTFGSELCGLMYILITLAHLPPATGKPECKITCNGKSALMQVQSLHPINPKEPHANLILACQY